MCPPGVPQRLSELRVRQPVLKSITAWRCVHDCTEYVSCLDFFLGFYCFSYRAVDRLHETVRATGILRATTITAFVPASASIVTAASIIVVVVVPAAASIPAV